MRLAFGAGMPWFVGVKQGAVLVDAEECLAPQFVVGSRTLCQEQRNAASFVRCVDAMALFVRLGVLHENGYLLLLYTPVTFIPNQPIKIPVYGVTPQHKTRWFVRNLASSP